MTDPFATMRNSHPLPPMDETPDHIGEVNDMPDEAGTLMTASNTAGEAGVVGAPPHYNYSLPVDDGGVRQLAEWTHKAKMYAAQRRAHAEAIGRPYPEERHSVWPR